MMNSLKPYLAFLIFFSAMSLADTRPLVKNDTELYPPLSADKIKGVPLAQSYWLLQSIRSEPLNPDAIITLEFNISAWDDSLRGKFKNNAQYEGVYTLRKNNHFTLNGFGQNQGNGAPDGSYEHYHLVTLYSITHYSIVGETLSFYDQGNNNILQFIRLPPMSASKPEDIYGRIWRLASATNTNKDKLLDFILDFAPKKTPYPEFIYSREFWQSTKKYQSEFKVSTSCRNYFGNCHIVDDLIAVFAIENTAENRSDRFVDPFCSQEDLLAENIFIDLLQKGWRYEVTGTRLELYSGQDKKLMFNQIIR